MHYDSPTTQYQIPSWSRHKNFTKTYELYASPSKKYANCFQQDIYKKIFLAHKYTKFNPRQLQIHTDWEPTKASIPLKGRFHVQQYLKQLKKNFKYPQRLNNLNLYQNLLL